MTERGRRGALAALLLAAVRTRARSARASRARDATPHAGSTCAGNAPGAQGPRPTLLIVSTATGYGGAERSMELLAPELARTARVVVMTGNARHRRNLLAAAGRAGVGGRLRVWHLPLDEGRRGTAESVLRCAAAHVWLRPDVVLANTARSARVVAWAARMLPRPRPATWLYVRDFLWTDLATVLRTAPHAGVLVPSPAVLERSEYLDRWVEPRPKRPLRIVPDMVALPEHTALSSRAADSGAYVLHLATVNPWKGHVHLIRAAEILRDDGKALWIRSRGVTGNAALRRALETRIAAAGLAGDARFELLDCVDAPDDELHGCFCVVVTSVSHSGGPETFGRTIIEAWAYGRPVVAFAAGGARHLIAHERDGLLVAEGDERGLAEALHRVRTDPELGARLGACGREKVRRHYELRSVARQLWNVLAEPAARG